MLPSITLDARAAHRPKRVRLSFQGREYVLEDATRMLTLGRAEENDVVVQGTLISRLHARIEFNRNRCLLVDQSTNGTFVTAEGGKESFVRRDSVALEGQGLIGLGRLPEEEAPDAIQYRLEG
jgi:predicted component of type VI protein secretion system